MVKRRASQTQGRASGQLEFSELLVRDSASPTVNEGFSEGFHYDKNGNFLGIVGAPEKADEDITEAISHQDPLLLEVSLLNGAPDNADPLLDELGAELLPIIQKRERAHQRYQRAIEAEEDRAVKRLQRTETYRDFLNEVERVRAPWKNIREIRRIVQTHFKTTRNLDDTRTLREYLNERIREADRATGRKVQTWTLEESPYVEGYRKLLYFSGEINPNTDFSRMQEALKQSFPRFGGIEYFPEFKGKKQSLEDSAPEDIRHIYKTLLDKAIIF